MCGALNGTVHFNRYYGFNICYKLLKKYISADIKAIFQFSTTYNACGLRVNCQY